MAKDNNIITWLKRIFSIQTISLIVALVAAYFTYKTYNDNKPGEITVELPLLNDDMDEITYIDASRIKRYFNLGFYTIPPVSINDGMMGGTLNMLLFPIIQNETNRSFKDFTADIYIWSDEPMHQLFQDSSDDEMFLDLTNYTITSWDKYSIHLTYNRNILLRKECSHTQLKVLCYIGHLMIYHQLEVMLCSTII